MSEKLQPVRGTHDALPDESLLRRKVVETARNVASLYGCGEIATPIFEFTQVFARTLGETSDIVTKEMYTFADRGGESLTLRPEFTAGIARAFISGGLQQHLPLKLFATGPLFRYERPQKGRMRQFHQIDVEFLGLGSARSDVELIALAAQILSALGLRDAVKLELNSLGDAMSRQAYRNELVAYFNDYRSELSEESQTRLERNPMRILDSKDEGDRKIVAGAPEMMASFNAESQEFFAQLQEGLAALGLTYTHNPKLVRGLDYYSHTVFEFTTDRLGAQNAVLAGGRYDALIGMMGGPDTPATGFAAGIERLCALAEAEMLVETPRAVAVIPVGAEAEIDAFQLAQSLRLAGVPVLYEYSGNMKKRLTRAGKQNALAAVLIGEEELAKGVVSVKYLDEGRQEDVTRDRLIDALKKIEGLGE